MLFKEIWDVYLALLRTSYTDVTQFTTKSSHSSLILIVNAFDFNCCCMSRRIGTWLTRHCRNAGFDFKFFDPLLQ